MVFKGFPPFFGYYTMKRKPMGENREFFFEEILGPNYFDRTDRRVPRVCLWHPSVGLIQIFVKGEFFVHRVLSLVVAYNLSVLFKESL